MQNGPKAMRTSCPARCIRERAYNVWQTIEITSSGKAVLQCQTLIVETKAYA
jgi:hypothetical protein